MKESDMEISQIPEDQSGSSERWISPDRVVITSGDGKLRSVDINPVLKPVLTEQGQKIGQVLEVALKTNPGGERASLDFVFKKNPQGDYQVLTAGWQSWSSSVAAGTMNDRLVGKQPSYKKSLGGRTVPFYEPGRGTEKIPEAQGRSYGLVGFRDMKSGGSGENVVLGVIPNFDSLENIRFRQDKDSIIVTVTKNLEGVSRERPVTFRIFLGQANPDQEGKLNYGDLMVAFSKELSKQVHLPLMKDRVIGFSWPVYGSKITQVDIEREIIAGRGIVDSYVIDDGWETSSGSLKVNQTKFPDLPGLAAEMENAGIEPGIWVSPFKVKDEEMKNLPPQWLMRDKNGRLQRVPLPGVAGLFERSPMFDISNPEVRAYQIEKLTNLARMGFKIFKADFLAVPFAGDLQNKDKTSVEYYRQFFEEWRQNVRNQLGREIEIIGCGAPIMESIGLFNGIRMTPDSAFPLEAFIPLPERFKSIPRWAGRKINSGLYKDAVAVGARRALHLNSAYGLIWDGIHAVDEKVPLNRDKRERLNQSILALNRLGVGNLFVGDSLARIGEQGRQTWRNFINVFKTGNRELVLSNRVLPKIPDRFSPLKST